MLVEAVGLGYVYRLLLTQHGGLDGTPSPIRFGRRFFSFFSDIHDNENVYDDDGCGLMLKK